MKIEELIQTLPESNDENQYPKYEKPVIIEREGLEFVEKILQQFQSNDLVVTCTKCHHCR